jgi:hypothetical protein
MSAQLAQGLDQAAWDMLRALVLVALGMAALALLVAGWGRARSDVAARRRGAFAVGPWPPASTGLRLLLRGGPVRLRTAGGEILVEDGGALVITRSRLPRSPRGPRLVVAEGETVRVPLGGLDRMERPSPERALWLVAGPAASVGGQLQPPLPRPGRRL